MSRCLGLECNARNPEMAEMAMAIGGFIPLRSLWQEGLGASCVTAAPVSSAFRRSPRHTCVMTGSS